MKFNFIHLIQGFPNWGTCTLLEGVHLTLGIEGKNMFIYYSFPIIYAYISEYNGRPNNFSRGDIVSLFLTLFRLLYMQCKWIFTKHFTLSTPQRKCPVLWQQSQKWASLAAIAKYIMIIFSIGYLQIFKTGYFFTNVLPLRLTKPQITI